MWAFVDATKGEPAGYFCVTDHEKMDPRKSIPPAFGGDCKFPRDSSGGGRFDLRIQCVLGSPGTKDFGSVLMTINGSASATEMLLNLVPQVSGNRPRFSDLAAFVRTEKSERRRWMRACFADEKPGPQWTRPRDAPEPRAASTSAQLPPRTQPLGQPRRDPTRQALPQYEGLGSQSFIEALGVHQAESKPGAAGNVIEVRVAPSTRPLVLVLSANTDVRWKLSLDSGAQLAAIFFVDQSVKRSSESDQGYSFMTWAAPRPTLRPT